MTASRALVLALLLALAGAFPLSALAQTTEGAQKFYPDDPLWTDNDKLDVPEKPEEIELSDYYDRFGHMFHDWGRSPIGSEAVNVNTLDEVPNSSWFTNRVGRRAMSLEEVVSGANRGSGPDPSEIWTIFRSKSQGLTPGFQIYDEKGDRYIIKFDPVDAPEMASAAEVISSKLFYALGYHTPENYIVRVHPDQFAIEPGTEVEDSFGDKMPLTSFRFRRMIRRVPRLEDGSLRVTASKYLDGVPLGPFRYYETRSDDPNDVIRHEDRRELRGLRLFAAWLNHDDTRAQNTQDSYVEENGTHYVRHYLLDFGSTLGSGSVILQYPYATFQYTIDLREARRNLLGFGLRVPEYRNVDWPDFPENLAVGRIESERYDPETWKNDYPNPAFVRMTARDAFWAAKILMRLTPEQIAGIVETGEYSKAEDTAYLLETLLARQVKTGRFGINVINPLDGFAVEGGALTFENLSETYGFVEAASRYEVSWSTYDNASDETRPLSGGGPVGASTSAARFELPSGVRSGLYLRADIRTLNEEHPHWATTISVYLRPGRGASWEVVGIERESPETSVFPLE